MGRVAGAAAEDEDAGTVSSVEHFSRDLGHLRELYDHRVPMVRAAGAMADFMQPVAKDAHRPQRSGRALAAARSVREFKPAIIGVGDVVVGYDELIDRHAVALRLGVHGLGQVLERAQTKPVFIEKAGRRHSVVMSVEQYDALLAASGAEPRIKSSKEFYERYKDWVDEQNRHFEEHGLWNDELRTW